MYYPRGRARLPSGAAFALSRSDPLSPLPATQPVPADNTPRYGAPLAGGPGPTGPARSGLSPRVSLLEPAAGQEVYSPNDC
jgi:hypothetical protein